MRDEDCALHGIVPNTDAWYDAVAAVLIDVSHKIKDPEVGWFGFGIGEDTVNHIAGFNYTIGLEENWGQTEVFVMGLRYDIGHAILARVVDLVKEGKRFADGDESDGIAEGFGARFRAPASGGWLVSFGVARRYYGRDISYLQLVWPDPKGIFPGEPGMDQRMERMQAVG